MRGLPRFLAWRRPLTLAAAALAGAVALATGAGTGIDEFAAMVRSGFSLHPASGAVHVVEIDEKSIEAIARWPWPRGVHARAVDRLRAAGVRSIAFDVDFSTPSLPGEDARFAAALARAGGGVILPTFRRHKSAASGATSEAEPIPALARNAFLAAANVDPDADGRLRRMLFGLEIGGAARPSLASMVAERPGAAGRSFTIDSAIDPDSIPRHSFIDLIEGRIPPSALKGARVLIGATAVELGDRYPVPRHSVIPGVVAQAMAAETLLEGPTPAERSPIWALLLALLLVAAATFAKGAPRSLRAAAYGLGAPAILALSLAPARLGAVPLGPAAAALAAAAIVGGAAWAALRQSETRLEDADTGLPNLRALERAAERLPTLAVGVARIDGYDALLSVFGAEAAAAIVARVASRLGFAAGVDVVCRADEASLAWIEPPGEAFADRIEGIAALVSAAAKNEAPADLRLHFGCAEGRGADARQVAANALLAAAGATAAGKTWQLFTVADGEAASRDVALLAGFSSALEDGRIWNAYQPKLDVEGGRIVAVEALVRWDHAEFGPLPPDRFVPLLERHGRAAELTLHVLARALADAAGWARAGRPLGVAVNVCANLLHDDAAMARLAELVRGSGFAAAQLTLEVTETAALADPARAIAALRAWRALGVGVSIDDYGTGQSSLAYLQTLPATELKIDKSFVATIATEPRNAIMVRSTIALAHELGLKVVAEGVEDEACLAALRSMGCDLAQGYLIARPMPAEAVLALQTDRSGGPGAAGAACVARFASRS
ncbi:MAG: EAL domain-containing protein [Alphaproteobacteria bacterium]|nr:EAL domain-containing protein [Alphaproteobacteria bacterium]MBV9372643.1 EAL domain-containing protein [Alphaproteobacteria bacterium]MBV9900150.1 EAL domain-containing protein [Alphaproteobacteria bacterium]